MEEGKIIETKKELRMKIIIAQGLELTKLHYKQKREESPFARATGEALSSGESRVSVTAVKPAWCYGWSPSSSR